MKKTKSAILDIFNGVRGHIETMNMPLEAIQQKNKVCEAEEELKERLSPEMFKVHQKFVDALENNWSNELDFYFVEGFKLGLLIGIECMQE